MHWFSAFMVFLGSWISGFFIIVTDAWMQHPVAYTQVDGQFEVISFWQLLLNPWGLLQYMHNMTGAVVTGSFVMAAVGAFYLLEGRNQEFGRIFSRWESLPASSPPSPSSFPPATCTASTWRTISLPPWPRWKACSTPRTGAGIVLMGQPNEETGEIDNPIVVNNVLSFLIYGTTKAEVKGLDQIPRDQWPTALPLLFYAYHIMAGLGTWFVLLMVVSALLLWRGKLSHHALGAVGAAAQFPAALHRQHRRLDDRRTRPPALADLWPDAHQRGILAALSPPATACSRCSASWGSTRCWACSSRC